AGIQPSSVERWVSNMKAQWDIYTHRTLRYEDLREILIAIKDNAQGYIHGRKNLELDHHLNRLRNSISFPDESTSEAKLIAKSRKEFKRNENQALREHPLSRPVAEANFS
ncbi:MAG: hypothetical protein ABEJ56_04300, partial [Candidatus Nanohaloarchaea archaeon]